jgi:protease-4
LKYGLREEIKLETDQGVAYSRRLADGGVFTAQQAKEFGLVDRIGFQEDAIAEARQLANLSEAKVITYEKPLTFVDALLGVRLQASVSQTTLDMLPGVTARLWYLTPGYELAGQKLPFPWLR